MIVNTEELKTIRDVAKKLGVHRNYIYTRLRAGIDIEVVQISNIKFIRVPKSDLEKEDWGLWEKINVFPKK